MVASRLPAALMRRGLGMYIVSTTQERGDKDGTQTQNPNGSSQRNNREICVKKMGKKQPGDHCQT